MAGRGDSGMSAVKVRGAHCIVNDVRLHYLDFSGGGIPMLILPGITSPAATWAFVAQHLARDRRIIVADIRGRGYSLDAYAADALGMIAAAGLDRPIILGHSMGARIAIRLAATHPDAARALIMADPPLTGPGRPPYPTAIESYLAAHAAASNGATIEQFRPFNPGWSDDQIARRLKWLPTCAVEAIRATYDNFHAEDIHADLPHILCPAVLIRAENAAVVTPEGEAEVASLLPRGTMRTIAAGHMIPWDNLGDFLDIVRAFVNGLDD